MTKLDLAVRDVIDMARVVSMKLKILGTCEEGTIIEFAYEMDALMAAVEVYDKLIELQKERQQAHPKSVRKRRILPHH